MLVTYLRTYIICFYIFTGPRRLRFIYVPAEIGLAVRVRDDGITISVTVWYDENTTEHTRYDSNGNNGKFQMNENRPGTETRRASRGPR